MAMMLIIILLIILLVWWFFVNYGKQYAAETFNPRFSDEYMGPNNIASMFISPYRHIRLNDGNGVMWESSAPPTLYDNSCHRAQCPQGTNEFDNMDTCWKCDENVVYEMNVPYIWPH